MFKDLKKKVVLMTEEKGNLNRVMETIFFFKKSKWNYKTESIIIEIKIHWLNSATVWRGRKIELLTLKMD